MLNKSAERFFYALVGIIIAVGGAYSLRLDDPVLSTVLLIGGAGLFFWQIVDSIWELNNDGNETKAKLTGERTKFITAIASTPPETRAWLSLEWPELGVLDVEVKPAIYVLHHGINTGILLLCLQRFLEDSDEREFADVRRYNEDTRLQNELQISRDGVRQQFDLVAKHLVKKGYLVPNSSAGSHSFLWVTKNHYYRMVQLYIKSTKDLPNIGIAQEIPA